MMSVTHGSTAIAKKLQIILLLVKGKKVGCVLVESVDSVSVLTDSCF